MVGVPCRNDGPCPIEAETLKLVSATRKPETRPFQRTDLGDQNCHGKPQPIRPAVDGPQVGSSKRAHRDSARSMSESSCGRGSAARRSMGQTLVVAFTPRELEHYRHLNTSLHFLIQVFADAISNPWRPTSQCSKMDVEFRLQIPWSSE